MSATDRAVVVSLFILCVSFGIVMANEVNAEFNSELGRAFIKAEITPDINYTNTGNYDGSTGSLNRTVADIGEARIPQGINFDFGFWQSIKILTIFWEVLIFSVAGFPEFLNIAFGMPALLVTPMQFMIGLSHILLAIFIITGKKF